MLGERITSTNAKVGDLIVIKDKPTGTITKDYLANLGALYKYLKITSIHSSAKDVVYVDAYDKNDKKLAIGTSNNYVSIGYQGAYDCYKYTPFELDDVLNNLDKLAGKLEGVKS